MTVGTKSVLFGAHAFWLHPWFVALAWWQLYGFPWDPRLWACFFVHDLGYWGCPNMDGEEGERHPEVAAGWIRPLFGDTWADLVLYHSRFYAKRDGAPPSQLCMADKLAVCLEPWWLYLPRVIASGEIDEYMALARARDERGEGKYAGERKYAGMNLATGTRRGWFDSMTGYLMRWVEEHRDGRPDTWTPSAIAVRKAR